jgi:hypothetical protein
VGRLNTSSSFTLARELGVAGMWVTLEARGMVSPEKSVDFTGELVELGITVDY